MRLIKFGLLTLVLFMAARNILLLSKVSVYWKKSVLQKQNKSVCKWDIENTGIKEKKAEYGLQDYYLKHSIDEHKGYAGHSIEFAF